MTNLRDAKDVMLQHKTLGNVTLAEAIDLHLLWVNKEAEGKRLEAYKADLRQTDLSEANLSKAHLKGVSGIFWYRLRRLLSGK